MTSGERLLSEGETEVIRAAFVSWLGVNSRGVIVFPLGSIQPVPKPVQHRPDGRGRLPSRVTPEGARHPVWWLDAYTKWKDPDEDELGYGLRLMWALDARDLLVPGDGPVDVLAGRLGWALGDPKIDARITAYARGAWDGELCRLELGPKPMRASRSGAGRDRDCHKRQARQIVRRWHALDPDVPDSATPDDPPPTYLDLAPLPQ